MNRSIASTDSSTSSSKDWAGVRDIGTAAGTSRPRKPRPRRSLCRTRTSVGEWPTTIDDEATWSVMTFGRLVDVIDPNGFWVRCGRPRRVGHISGTASDSTAIAFRP